MTDNPDPRLREIAALAAGDRSPLEFVEALTAKAAEIFAAEAAIAYILNEAAAGFEPRAAVGIALDDLARVSALKPPPLFAEALQTRQPQAAVDMPDPLARSHGMSALLYAPAPGRNRIVGMLALGRRTATEFTADDRQLATLLCNRIGETIERERELAELAANLDRMSVLTQASTVVSSSRDLHEVLQALSNQMLMATNATGCSVSSLDKESQQLTTLFHLLRGSQQDNSQPPGTVYDVAEYPTIGGVLETRQHCCVLGTDPQAEPALQALMEARGAQALLILPMVARNQVIGLVEIESRVGEHVFSPDQIKLAQVLANQLGLAIHNARLYGEMQADLQTRANELAILNTIGQDITASLDISKILSRVYTLVRDTLQAQACSLFLVSPETGALHYHSGYGEGTDRLARLSAPLPRSKGIAGWAAEHKQSVIVNEVTKDERFYSEFDRKTGFLTRSVAAAPLIIRDRVVGVVEAINKHTGDFTPDDERLLNSVATWAAVAIENANLYNSAQEEQYKFEAAINNVADAVLVVDTKHQIIYANSAARRALDMPDQDLPYPVGKLIAAAPPGTGALNAHADGSPKSTLPAAKRAGNLEPTAAPLANLLTSPISDGEIVAEEVTLHSGRTYHVSVSPVANVGRVGLMHDITLQKTLDELRTQFVGTAAHDLKNPVNVVQIAAGAIPAAGPLNERQQQAVRLLDNAAQKMTALINDLLDITRIEAGLDLALQPCSVADIFADSATSLGQFAQEKQVDIQLDFPADLPKALADLGRLQQVTNNLLSNAIKYTPSGGRVHMTAAAAGDHLVARVSDTGIGISEEDLPHVFDQFFRVRSTASRHVEGTGLGLAIVKSLVEQHRGRIWVESTLDAGTTFYFTLPIAGNDQTL